MRSSESVSVTVASGGRESVVGGAIVGGIARLSATTGAGVALSAVIAGERSGIAGLQATIATTTR